MFFSIFSFCIFLLGLSLGKALRPPVNVRVKQYNQNMESDIYGNTALPLAPNLQKPQIPQSQPLDITSIDKLVVVSIQ